MKFFRRAIPILLLSAACTRSIPATMPSPDVSQPATPVSSTPTRNWILTPDESSHSYTSRVTSSLELQDAGSVVRDSFMVTLDFTLKVQRDKEASRVTGTLDRFQRDPGSRTPEIETPVALPLSFAGQVVSGGLVLDSVGGRAIATVADCDDAGLNQMSVIQRNLSLAPLILQTGTTWTDSSTVAACSGTVPVKLTTVRTYRVTGETRESGTSAIAVERSERISAIGEGSQGQHRIGLQAAGTGSARLLLEPGSGLLRLATSESRTTVSVRSSGRQQHFVQAVKEETIRLR